MRRAGDGPAPGETGSLFPTAGRGAAPGPGAAWAQPRRSRTRQELPGAPRTALARESLLHGNRPPRPRAGRARAGAAHRVWWLQSRPGRGPLHGAPSVPLPRQRLGGAAPHLREPSSAPGAEIPGRVWGFHEAPPPAGNSPTRVRAPRRPVAGAWLGAAADTVGPAPPARGNVPFRSGTATFPGAAPRAAEGPPLATRGTDMRGPQYAPLNPLRQEAAHPGLSAASPWSPHAAAACGFRHRAGETRRCRHLHQALGPLPRALWPSCNGGSPPLGAPSPGSPQPQGPPSSAAPGSGARALPGRARGRSLAPASRCRLGPTGESGGPGPCGVVGPEQPAAWSRHGVSSPAPGPRQHRADVPVRPPGGPPGGAGRAPAPRALPPAAGPVGAVLSHAWGGGRAARASPLRAAPARPSPAPSPPRSPAGLRQSPGPAVDGQPGPGGAASLTSRSGICTGCGAAAAGAQCLSGRWRELLELELVSARL